MKCKLVRDMPCHDKPAFPNDMVPAGTELEDPRAYFLVGMGVAVPVDEECKAKCQPRSPEDEAAALHSYNRLEAGVAQEDFGAYDKGYMLGYDEDGKWIPGPNYEEYRQEEWEQHKQESPIEIVEG
jgi:hypothetical protein